MYHRVETIEFVDPLFDDWNVLPRQFERQIAALAAFADLVPLHDLPRLVAERSSQATPLVSLTFDDGYAGFFTQALPILQKYQVPATVFVVSGQVGSPDPMPFDEWSQRNRERVMPHVCRSMNWREIEACVDTGLVTVGSHSLRHLRGTECDRDELCSEAEHSREILRKHLGPAHGNIYAYPWGSTRLRLVPPQYREAVKQAGYELAVSSDLGLVSTDSDPLLLPRVEAHALDAPRVLRAKTRGALAPYYLVDRLRRSRRAPGRIT